MAARRRIPSRLVNLLVAGIATIIVLAAAEPLLRLRYVEPAPDRPVVREVQPWLVLDPDVGYTWKPNVTPDNNVRFANADVEAPPLSTDEFGVINAPEAIAARRGGEPVVVLGLGDSFMEMAAPEFYRAFNAHGHLYYSLAIHRHAPPHYARLFESRGLGLTPRHVVVGLFENDFVETGDFDNWQRSGIDWFAFHSGTWCGPAVPDSTAGRILARYTAGYRGLADAIRARVRGQRMTVTGPTPAQVDRVIEELTGLTDRARASGIAVWVMLIPSKPTASGETTHEARVYDQVADAIRPSVAGIVDLRPVFQSHPDPQSLYYRLDGHWNSAGIALAAQTLLEQMAAVMVEDESRSG